MTFLKGVDGRPLVLYRGERSCADHNHIRTQVRAVYFTDNKETASAIASPFGIRDLEFDAPRVFPVQLRIKHLFINQPDNPMLELSTLADKLGNSEARRIALKFSIYIERTDSWKAVNYHGRYKSVEEYLQDPHANFGSLYFPASWFFLSNAEVGRIARLGYDGAIHGGNGIIVDGKVEYIAFSKSQIHYTLSGVADDEEEYILRRA